MINKNVVVIACVCLGLFGCAEQNWHDVKSSQHGFSVRMPGKLEEHSFTWSTPRISFSNRRQ